MASTFPFCNGPSLREWLAEVINTMKSEIEGNDENYLLNVNEADYVAHMVSRYTVAPPTVRFEDKAVSQVERMVPAESFSPEFHVRRGESYRKPAFIYHVPFEGNAKLFHYQPSSYFSSSVPVWIEDNAICFEVISMSEDVGEISAVGNRNIGYMTQCVGHLANDLAAHARQVEHDAARFFNERKARILTNRNMLAALNLPIKVNPDLAQTFAIPTPAVRVSAQVKPPASTQGFVPDPTLDPTIYTNILQTIHDVCQVMERLPSIYRNRSEEDLRDLLLLYLEPRYYGSATGETFNSIGKTDILIRHEGKNAFVAECKFWHGQKGYFDTIDQLLGYLTWRDAKAAVVMFVKNKDISTVQATVSTETPKHANYLRTLDQPDESWTNYRFHLIGDPSREVRLAVLLFHVPL